MRIRALVALAASLLLGGCAAISPKFDQAALCPAGPSKENSGEIYLITYPMNGYLSLWKDRWPWSESNLGQYVKSNPKLELVCIEPRVPSLGSKQRQAVFKVSGTNTYIFGAVKYGNTVGGVVPESDINLAKQLIGNPVWFASRTESTYFKKMDNLTPYIVKRIELGKGITDKSEIYIIVMLKNEEARIPIIKTESGKFTVPGKVLFTTEPTPEKLNISKTEFELIQQSRVVIGMSEFGVNLSWGSPDNINRTSTASGTSKQLVYDPGRSYTKYVYVDNGVVTAIQD